MLTTEEKYATVIAVHQKVDNQIRERRARKDMKKAFNQFMRDLKKRDDFIHQCIVGDLSERLEGLLCRYKSVVEGKENAR